MSKSAVGGAMAAWRRAGYNLVALLPACLPACGCSCDPPPPPPEVEQDAVKPEEIPDEIVQDSGTGGGTEFNPNELFPDPVKEDSPPVNEKQGPNGGQTQPKQAKSDIPKNPTAGNPAGSPAGGGTPVAEP